MLSDFFIKVRHRIQSYLSNPAVQGKLRLAGIITLALLAVSAVILFVFFGLGALLLNTLVMAMVFSVCCSIPVLVFATFYIPVALRERFPPPPDSAEPSAPPREPDPPFVLKNLTSALEAARTCTDEDFERFTSLILELYTLQRFNTFEPYQEAASWLQNRLTQNPEFAGRLQEYSVNKDRDYLLNLSGTLSTDKIETLIRTINNDQTHLTVQQKNQLNTYLKEQLIAKVKRLDTRISRPPAETPGTDDANLLPDARLDHMFKLCQCIDLCAAMALSDNGESDQALRNVRDQAVQCYQRHCEPLAQLCHQNGIHWVKAPLARAINQKLPLLSPGFQSSTLDRLEAYVVPAINLVDGDLVAYDQRPAYLDAHQQGTDNWVSRITHQPFVCEDIVRLDQLLSLESFSVNHLLNRQY